ncbi:hypothetical protein QOZ80_5BG0444290 [Eleusine coracana subsp. coracana]|nr:hypothetical protein QOZ80_5BG0444290 [Eleusine coracana subsp. coracana]
METRPPDAPMPTSDGRKRKAEKIKPRASWIGAHTRFLVSMMKEYNLTTRYHGQNGRTKEACNNMAKRLNDKYPTTNYTVGQLKDREQRLKKDHNIVKSITSKSGFGWDPEIKMPTTIDEKWKELSEAQQKWRNKPFPYYDDLYDIYDGKVADGKRCRRTSNCFVEREMTNLLSQEDNLHHNIEQEFDMGIEPEFGFGCIFKLKEIGLPAPEMMKAINYLKKYRLNREIFISIDIYLVLVEFIKEAISDTEN